METSNVAKYHVGQRVEGMGEKGDVSGIVTSVVPDTAGSAAGPGRIIVLADALTRLPTAGMEDMETSNVAKYHVGMRVEGLGEKGDVDGIVASVTPHARGALSGPGLIQVRLDSFETAAAGIPVTLPVIVEADTDTPTTARTFFASQEAAAQRQQARAAAAVPERNAPALAAEADRTEQARRDQAHTDAAAAAMAATERAQHAESALARADAVAAAEREAATLAAAAAEQAEREDQAQARADADAAAAAAAATAAAALAEQDAATAASAAATTVSEDDGQGAAKAPRGSQGAAASARASASSNTSGNRGVLVSNTRGLRLTTTSECGNNCGHGNDASDVRVAINSQPAAAARVSAQDQAHTRRPSLRAGACLLVIGFGAGLGLGLGLRSV